MSRLAVSRSFVGALLLALTITALNSATADTAGISTKQLLRTSVSGDDSKETIVLAIEFAPGSTTGRHTHPGDEYATVLEGILELRADGQEPRRVSTGEAYHNARGVIHETRNVGAAPARTVATFVVDKGKPLTQPAR